ncbi:MAG: sugar transferase [Dinoroseobacter sp.]|nr:sugar transferase [Dinoroseobacter sp.]MDJ0992317.1 sugar transferase [Dinoroseobacter sp.]
MSTCQAKFKADEPQLESAVNNRKTVPVGGFAKRVFDVAFSFVAILSTLPFFIVLPAIVMVVSPGPIFFAHTRIGYGGMPFPCLKFRTMVPNADQLLTEYLASNPEAQAEWDQHRKLKNDPRIIPFVGNLMRRLSFDELPQFFNVLRGEMSVVGPRPLTLDEVKDYGEAARRYKAARPGITGLWQVSGRSDISFRDRIDLDCRYVATCNLTSDIQLIARTISVLLNGRGAY